MIENPGQPRHNPAIPSPAYDIADWYEDQYQVYHKDIDFRGELRLSALLLMLQETAWNHAHQLGIGYSSAAFRDLVWVLSRMRIEILAPGPVWMHQVRLATSPTGIERLFAMRDFLAMDQNGVPFARISSAWILIDHLSRRPVRPENVLNQANFTYAAPIVPARTVRLAEPPDATPGRTLLCGWTDIDAHKHVNNVRYAEWCLDTYDQSQWNDCRIVEYDINFNAEMTWGQQAATAMSRSFPPEAVEAQGDPASEWQVNGLRLDERHTHVIRNLSDGTIAALVRFGWLKREEGVKGAEHTA